MPSLNKVLLIGNLVADPELKQTQSGLPVTTFRIAVNRRFAKKGEENQTDFISITAWRQQAEFVTRFFHKGKPIFVCGSLHMRNWTDQNGQKRYDYEVVADEIQFVETKGTSEGGYGDGTQGQSNFSSQGYGTQVPAFSSGTQDESAPKFEELTNEDDLPF